jgi:hypothetical protein
MGRTRVNMSRNKGHRTWCSTQQHIWRTKSHIFEIAMEEMVVAVEAKKELEVMHGTEEGAACQDATNQPSQ